MNTSKLCCACTFRKNYAANSMSVAVNVKIPNLNKFRAALRHSPLLVAKHVQTAMKESIVEIQRATIPITPHKTGELEQSLLRGVQISPLSGKIFSDKLYAEVQHEGISFKHPIKGTAKFLEKGVRLAEKKIQGHFEEAFNRVMRDIGNRSKE